jgi:hypothetical protein
MLKAAGLAALALPAHGARLQRRLHSRDVAGRRALTANGEMLNENRRQRR